MTRFSTFFFPFLFGSGVFPFSGAAFSCPDLALVLAIDGSGSIDTKDFALQQDGYAAAFADPRVQTALDLLAADEACAARRIINVSGDGKESHGARPRHRVPLELARQRAGRMGVTINGLAITVAGADLEGWYETSVITGAGAFVMTAGSFDAFGKAIIRKLAREIALPVLAVAETGQEPMR